MEKSIFSLSQTPPLIFLRLPRHARNALPPGVKFSRRGDAFQAGVVVESEFSCSLWFGATRQVNDSRPE